MEIPEKLKKPYDPKDTEGRIYEMWEKSGYFNPDNLPPLRPNSTIASQGKQGSSGQAVDRAETFSMVLPPPNVTGTLHTGHSLMLAIQDIMTRYARMQSKKTLWIPGTDHAAIATESVVVKQLAKEKKSKHDLGREQFLEQVNQFAQESHDTIVGQLKKMGASLDWSREAFTLDETRQKAVFTAFKQMYDDGLIYRGYRVVNWDPKGQTTVSDDEVNHESRPAKMYYFKYAKDFPITIATTRPETKLGDTAVAVNPDDDRYKNYIGQTFSVDFVGVPLSITIIGDKDVDPAFGTGALGVTPSHSQIDWDMAERHNLPKIQVINEYAKITVDHPDFKDKKTTEVREIIVEKLRTAGLLEKEEDIQQNISVSERTGAVIEPLPKLQWFIDVNKKTPQGKSLKELMLAVITEKKISILPERYEKIYLNWIENLRDWCISRQIWYGHRIPVWYPTTPEASRDKSELVISTTSPGEKWTQDPDTLDTWFSSGLWTFSTLGWPEHTDDLKTFHPTTVLETGHDIIFFWVARMILMSTYLLGEIPFKAVYLHGMVLDKNGKKMSKTRPETAIDPVSIIEKYGADALRMAMIVGNAPGGDVALSEDKIKAYSKFTNKLWNIARFVMENTAQSAQLTGDSLQVTKEHQKYIDELDAFATEITKEMDEYKFYLVSEKLYHYVWHTFADKVIEDLKPAIKGADEALQSSALFTTHYLLLTSLKLLHPFMPFLTEELWQLMHNGNSEKMLIIESWPKAR